MISSFRIVQDGDGWLAGAGQNWAREAQLADLKKYVRGVLQVQPADESGRPGLLLASAAADRMRWVSLSPGPAAQADAVQPAPMASIAIRLPGGRAVPGAARHARWADWPRSSAWPPSCRTPAQRLAARPGARRYRPGVRCHLPGCSSRR